LYAGRWDGEDGQSCPDRCGTTNALRLDPGADAASLHALLVPYPAEKMEAFPVNPWVNNSKHEGPRCLEPAAL
jgi:hypothetical protein